MTKADPTRKTWIKKNPYRALVAPAILIGTGALLINNPVYDRKDFHTDLFNTVNFKRTHVDDYLIYAPYVGLVALNLAKVKCQNDFINTALIIIKAEIFTTVMTFGLKEITHVQRPDSSNFKSWPSGHTSEAFMAATVVNREYRHKGPWVGIAAYGVATTVGVFRMLNNKHWLSDVVAGAGFGILGANLAYLTHQWRWGRPGSCLLPSFNEGKPGVYYVYRF
jgi:membrane-associated phospholipid phosphatase